MAESETTMSDILNYAGDLTNVDPDWMMGPDWGGAYWLPVTGDYNPATNITTLTVRPVPPAELEKRAALLLHKGRQKGRIKQLFGTQLQQVTMMNNNNAAGEA